MSTAAEHPLERFVAAAWPPSVWRDLHVVLAISGGPDSIALLRAVLALKERAGGAGRLFCAHFHHGLRGSAADEDETWVKNLCQGWRIPVDIGRADVSAVACEQGDGWEAAARDLRYEFLRISAERNGARWIAAGHNADDQAETVLHHLLRGTGLTGLAAMRVARPLSPSVTLVRPLLEVGRADVLQYLADLRQDYRSDATNADPRWMRSRLRNELLPLLRSRYKADVDRSLCRLAQQAGEAQELIAGLAAALAAQSISVGRKMAGASVRINCQRLMDQPALLVREVCKIAWVDASWPQQAMGFNEWQQLARLVREGDEAAVLNLPGGVRAQRERGGVVLLQGPRDAGATCGP